MCVCRLTPDYITRIYIFEVNGDTRCGKVLFDGIPYPDANIAEFGIAGTVKLLLCSQKVPPDPFGYNNHGMPPILKTPLQILQECLPREGNLRYQAIISRP